MSQPSHHSLTADQIAQIKAICTRFERAWQTGHSPAVEAVAAGADSVIRPALLQHLAELDIRQRIFRGNRIDVDFYLTRWPDLDRDRLQAAVAEAERTEATSFAAGRGLDAATRPGSNVSSCSIPDFFARLRNSRLLAEADVATIEASVSDLDSSTELGQRLIEAQRLTTYQVSTLLEGRSDPLALDEYVLHEVVGRGGMGIVFRALHRRMKRIVAVKILRRDIDQADMLSRRFLREVEVAARLSHPNIVTAYDAGEQNGVSYLVSEFVDGQNLGELVREYGPLSLPLAVDVIQQAARALEYAHREGVIHRDIKPSNLLLDDSGVVKLLDVGLARVSQPDLPNVESASDLTSTGMIMGTVDYMSPEQAQNTRRADERSDVYSLGCTLFFLITGRAPYPGGTGIERLLAHREQPIPLLRNLSSCIPQQLDDLIQSLMAKKSADRPASMAKVVQELEALKTAGLPDVTLALSSPEELQSTADSPLPATQLSDKSESGESPTAVMHEYSTADVVQDLQSDLEQMPLAASVSVPRATRRKTGGVATMMWWIVPAALALIVVTQLAPSSFVNRLLVQSEKSGPTNDSDTALLQRLSDMTEDDVLNYRERWAAKLNVDEEHSINGLIFMLIPPGRFLYGEGVEALETTFESEFYISEVEVTVGQFRKFVEASDNYQTIAELDGTGWGKVGNNWIQGADYCWKNLGENFVGDSTPACSIAYPDAIAFCDWMSAQSGRKVRLPSEPEWEYACRCGRRGMWSFGDDSAELNDFAWTRSNSESSIHPVRSLRPNAWGLFDMHGNEFEWCLEQTAVAPDFRGTGPVRGGSFASTPDQCRSSARKRTELRLPTQGAFRVLMER